MASALVVALLDGRLYPALAAGLKLCITGLYEHAEASMSCSEKMQGGGIE